MIDVEIDVGGSVHHKQVGMKIELGVASDHLVIYCDPNDWERSVATIDRSVRLHTYAKQLKAGMLPPKPAEAGTELPKVGGD